MAPEDELQGLSGFAGVREAVQGGPRDRTGAASCRQAALRAVQDVCGACSGLLSHDMQVCVQPFTMFVMFLECAEDCCHMTGRFLLFPSEVRDVCGACSGLLSHNVQILVVTFRMFVMFVQHFQDCYHMTCRSGSCRVVKGCGGIALLGVLN